MNIQEKDIDLSSIKFYIEQEGREIGRAYLYVLNNDLHENPFGFMEDVFVNDDLRGKGVGSALVRKVIEEAKRRECYKLICTSRNNKPEVHKLYENLGFTDYGKEFRMNF